MSRSYPYYAIYKVGCGTITRTNSYTLAESEETRQFLEEKAREFADETGRAHLILIFKDNQNSDLIEVVWPGGLYKLKING